MPGLDPEHFVESCHNLVYKLAHRLARRLPSAATLDADDLAQEGFAALIRAAPKYTKERGAPTTFATIVVRNRFNQLVARQYDRWARTDLVATPQPRAAAPEQEVLVALHDALRAGRLLRDRKRQYNFKARQAVLQDRYRRLRLSDLTTRSLGDVITAPDDAVRPR